MPLGTMAYNIFDKNCDCTFNSAHQKQFATSYRSADILNWYDYGTN